MGGANVVCCFSLKDPQIARSYTITKWAYCFLFTLVTIVTWVLRDYSDQWFFKSSASIFSYCEIPGLQSLCSSRQVAVRFSFANFAFFAAHAIILIWCRKESDVRAGFHTGFWFWKILIWAGAIVGFFFVPSAAIQVYAQAARAGAALFLVFVMVEMVSWVYDVNTWLVSRDNKLAWTALVAGAAVTFLGGLSLIGICYWLYAKSPACHLNLFFITWSIVVGGALVGVLFVPKRLEVAGLLTSGAVFLYCSYLLYSALGRAPAGQCVRLTVSDQWVQIVGFFLAIGAVCYSTMSLGTSNIFATEAAGAAVATAEADAEGLLPYRPDAFHLMFALASMYMAMLFTNWQVSSNTSRFELGTGWASTWATMGSKWFCELLYLWTVIAPAVLRDRDFS